MHLAYFSLALVCLLTLLGLLLPLSFDSIVLKIEDQCASAFFGLFTDQHSYSYVKIIEQFI